MFGAGLGHGLPGAGVRPPQLEIPLEGLDRFLLIFELVRIQRAERKIDVDIAWIGRQRCTQGLLRLGILPALLIDES